MLRFLLLHLLVCMIASTSYTSGQDTTTEPSFCHTCELIINDAKAFFNNNFANVSLDQLRHQLEVGCDKYHGDDHSADGLCRSMVDIQAGAVLENLKAGVDSYRICIHHFLCGI